MSRFRIAFVSPTKRWHHVLLKRQTRTHNAATMATILTAASQYFRCTIVALHTRRCAAVRGRIQPLWKNARSAESTKAYLTGRSAVLSFQSTTPSNLMVNSHTLNAVEYILVKSRSNTCFWILVARRSQKQLQRAGFPVSLHKFEERTVLQYLRVTQYRWINAGSSHLSCHYEGLKHRLCYSNAKKKSFTIHANSYKKTRLNFSYSGGSGWNQFQKGSILHVTTSKHMGSSRQNREIRSRLTRCFPPSVFSTRQHSSIAVSVSAISVHATIDCNQTDRRVRWWFCINGDHERILGDNDRHDTTTISVSFMLFYSCIESFWHIRIFF